MQEASPFYLESEGEYSLDAEEVEEAGAELLYKRITLLPFNSAIDLPAERSE
jgi:hypothetical protein